MADGAAERRGRVRITLPGALRALFPDAPASLEAEAGTVAEAIDALEVRFPGMGGRLRDSRPALRRHIVVFVAGARAELDTPLGPGATVHVLTAISGG